MSAYICGRNGIILNPEKFVFGAPTVDFAGFTIIMTDVRPCSRDLESIRDFRVTSPTSDRGSGWAIKLKRTTLSFEKEEKGDMDLCSYARNGELKFFCADVYAVDCDSAGFKYEVHAI